MVFQLEADGNGGDAPEEIALGLFRCNLAAQNEGTAVDNHGAATVHLLQDRKDRGQGIDPLCRGNLAVHRQLVNDLDVDRIETGMRALKNLSETGRIGKRAAECQCPVFDSRMKAGGDHRLRGSFRKMARDAD